MLYSLAFLFYYDDKLQFKWPSEESNNIIASEVVDLGIIRSPVKPKTQKLVFTASLSDAQH